MCAVVPQGRPPPCPLPSGCVLLANCFGPPCVLWGLGFLQPHFAPKPPCRLTLFTALAKRPPGTNSTVGASFTFNGHMFEVHFALYDVPCFREVYLIVRPAMASKLGCHNKQGLQCTLSSH
eukprot:GGOE01010132.1.p2 GENE.GGOE01010132.1~~GGOE01010132.1.p2  ORF type:complete len:121 (+),score=9.00 GGOE01010132.1:932-1294(+)